MEDKQCSQIHNPDEAHELNEIIEDMCDLSAFRKKISQMTKQENILQCIVMVFSIDLDNNSFIISDLEGETYIECIYNNNLEILKSGDTIQIEGFLRMHPRNIGKLYVEVSHYHLIDDKYIYNKNISSNKKLVATLTGEEYQKKVKQIRSAKIPELITNIALITLPNNNINIQNFKIVFQERCVGKLFIYQLQYDKSSTSLITALEYFNKYHDIHLICLLTNKLTTQDICELSSVDNVKYLLNRKQEPYLLSIISSDNTESITSTLSNQRIQGINNCVDYIHQIQVSYKNNLNNSLNKAKCLLNNIVNKYYYKLLDFRLAMVRLYDKNFLYGIRYLEESFEHLRRILLDKLMKEKQILFNMKRCIMQNIIDHQQIQAMLPKS